MEDGSSEVPSVSSVPAVPLGRKFKRYSNVHPESWLPEWDRFCAWLWRHPGHAVPYVAALEELSMSGRYPWLAMEIFQSYTPKLGERAYQRAAAQKFVGWMRYQDNWQLEHKTVFRSCWRFWFVRVNAEIGWLYAPTWGDPERLPLEVQMTPAAEYGYATPKRVKAGESKPKMLKDMSFSNPRSPHAARKPVQGPLCWDAVRQGRRGERKKGPRKAPGVPQEISPPGWEVITMPAKSWAAQVEDEAMYMTLPEAPPAEMELGVNEFEEIHMTPNVLAQWTAVRTTLMGRQVRTREVHAEITAGAYPDLAQYIRRKHADVSALADWIKVKGNLNGWSTAELIPAEGLPPAPERVFRFVKIFDHVPLDLPQPAPLSIPSTPMLSAPEGLDGLAPLSIEQEISEYLPPLAESSIPTLESSVSSSFPASMTPASMPSEPAPESPKTPSELPVAVIPPSVAPKSQGSGKRISRRIGLPVGPPKIPALVPVPNTWPVAGNVAPPGLYAGVSSGVLYLIFEVGVVYRLEGEDMVLVENPSLGALFPVMPAK